MQAAAFAWAAFAAPACKCTFGNCAKLSLPPSGSYLCVRDVSQDIPVVGSILRDGLWEGHIVRPFYDEILQHKHAIVLDVGAHIGQYTIVAAAAGARVVAFEANADNVQYIESSLQVNKVNDRVTVINKPVSAEGGQRLQFPTSILPQDNVGGWGVQLSPTGSLVSTTIDASLASLHLIGPYIMKIDIEGFEPQALLGAQHTLRHTRIIFMEWGDGGPEKRKMAQNLKRVGFVVNDNNCIRTNFKVCPWDVVWRRNNI